MLELDLNDADVELLEVEVEPIWLTEAEGFFSPKLVANPGGGQIHSIVALLQVFLRATLIRKSR